MVKNMKKLVIGLLAHVDSGKTTLSEGLLYLGGTLKKLGRVDHRDSFLDTNFLERNRGITIFSKQAILSYQDMEVTLLDTPGHADFSSEMERTLQVLDYAILVVSGSDGIQGHTGTLWQLLARHRIPTFLFINKMDLAGTNRKKLLKQLKRNLSENCVDFGESRETLQENIALCDETVMAHYFEYGSVGQEETASLIKRRKLFPCYFGSALKLDGMEALLDGLETYTRSPDYPPEFGAKVFKISRDSQGARLTHLKVTGGSLKVKAQLSGRDSASSEDRAWDEKVDQIRVYSGEKYQTTAEAVAGTVCAVTGLSHTFCGEGFGIEPASESPFLEPVLSYQVLLPDGYDTHSALLKLNQLAEEDPQLHIVWKEQLREIHLQLMGEVQLQILKELIWNRFHLEITFGPGNIVYRETIAAPVVGVGHFEPLRHYAEVHLLLEPGKPGSGLSFGTACSEDMLDKNWQRLILTHLEERAHPGVLTGSPITDMKITLISGRAHVKHTEGGDFRQATYRAVRQGLMCAENVLLEPWCEFRLEVASPLIGRAMSDLQRMSGEVSQPETDGQNSILTGIVPVSELKGYAAEVSSYTRGQGRLSSTYKEYRPCHNQSEVISQIGYDCERDTENPADSVFCSQGSGFVVKWNQARRHMHVDTGLNFEKQVIKPETAPDQSRSSGSVFSALEQDRELKAIFERTYGPVTRKRFHTPERSRGRTAASPPKYTVTSRFSGPEYLLVDGYNIIFAWDELKKAAAESLDSARQLLMNILSNYQGFRKCVVIVVFDAYKVPHQTGEVSRYHNIHVVFTKEAETADAYIAKATLEIGKSHRVVVATSDAAEQLIILGHGALRLSAQAFRTEVQKTEKQISAILASHNSHRTYRSVNAAFQKAMREQGSGSSFSSDQ